MKMNKDSRKASEANGSEQSKVRSVVSDKKEKNLKRTIYEEIEEDEEIDFKKFLKKEDSILSYYDEEESEDEDWDDEEWDEDDEWDDDDDEWDDDDDEWDEDDEM